MDKVNVPDKKDSKKIKTILSSVLMAIGAVLIIVSVLLRTPYPMLFKDKGLTSFSYHHVLLREVQHYNMFKKMTGKDINYYIVYMSSDGLFYEKEVSQEEYEEHAHQENVAEGITDRTAIHETELKYTYLANNNKTYCYDSAQSLIKVYFDAGREGFVLRVVLDASGAILIIAGALALKKVRSKKDAVPAAETDNDEDTP